MPNWELAVKDSAGNPDVGGTTNPAPNVTYTNNVGDPITYEAIPDSANGYVFSHWESTANGYFALSEAYRETVMPDYGWGLTAIFYRPGVDPDPDIRQRLTTLVSGNGSVSLDVANTPGFYKQIEGADPPQYVISQGTTARLAATPAAGSTFTHWTWGTETYYENPVDFLMPIGYGTSITAEFTSACTVDTDCAPCHQCLDNTCVPRADGVVDTRCPTNKPYCLGGVCVECINDDHCAEGWHCEAGVCIQDEPPVEPFKGISGPLGFWSFPLLNRLLEFIRGRGG